MCRMVCAVLAALLATLVAAFPGMASTRAAATPDLVFKGARIGMTLDQWRSLAYPGRAGDHAVAACSAGLAAAGAQPATTASRTPAPIVTCGYKAKYVPGPAILEHGASPKIL